MVLAIACRRSLHSAFLVLMRISETLGSRLYRDTSFMRSTGASRWGAKLWDLRRQKIPFHQSRTKSPTTLQDSETPGRVQKKVTNPQRRSAMIKGHTRARNFLTQWPLPIAAAIVVAAGAGATASAPPADAQPPGTLCGHVQNRVGVSLPVIVLSGDPDCVTAVHVASDYVNGPRDSDGGTLQLQNVDGWQCEVPLLPGRSHADSYLECDQSGSGFKIGN